MTLPVDLRIEAPGILPQPISGNGEVKLAGTTVTINSLSGMLGDARFSGYASIEATTKPLVKVNLDFKQLDIDAPSSVASRAPAKSDGWNDDALKLDGLNYVDAEFQVSAGALNVGTLKLSPAKIEGTLGAGILRMTMSELGFVRRTQWPALRGTRRSGARCSRCAPNWLAFARCRFCQQRGGLHQARRDAGAARRAFVGAEPSAR